MIKVMIMFSIMIMMMVMTMMVMMMMMKALEKNDDLWFSHRATGAVRPYVHPQRMGYYGCRSLFSLFNSTHSLGV